MIVIITGVTGAGKTTVGKLLAGELGWRFYDADNAHPAANIEKLKQGRPLNDEDRKPWLKAIQRLIETGIERGENAVIACSALKESYREFLRIGPEVVFVYLKAAAPLVEERLAKRTGHFMNPALVQSQFQILEEPEDGFSVDASLSPAQIIRQIRMHLPA